MSGNKSAQNPSGMPRSNPGIQMTFTGPCTTFVLTSPGDYNITFNSGQRPDASLPIRGGWVRFPPLNFTQMPSKNGGAGASGQLNLPW